MSTESKTQETKICDRCKVKVTYDVDGGGDPKEPEEVAKVLKDWVALRIFSHDGDLVRTEIDLCPVCNGQLIKFLAKTK